LPSNLLIANSFPHIQKHEPKLSGECWALRIVIMVAAQTRPFTAEDYRQLPPDNWRYQLIEGELVNMAPSPNTFHQTIASNIVAIINRHLANGPGGRLYFAPLDVYLTDTNVFQPDVLFVRKERETIIEEDGLHGGPDFVVEILSPHTARYDINAKREVYARCGVEELWLVYPKAKRIDVYLLQRDSQRPTHSHQPGEKFTSEIFPGLAFSVDEIFRTP
jgi:Uma2 family endonuclease